MTAPDEITDVEHLGGYRLRLRSADGVVGDIDLSGRIEAAKGADLAPEVLHEQALSLI